MEDDGPEDGFHAFGEVAHADAVAGDGFDFFGVEEAPFDEAAGVVEHALAPLFESFVAVVGTHVFPVKQRPRRVFQRDYSLRGKLAK